MYPWRIDILIARKDMTEERFRNMSIESNGFSKNDMYILSSSQHLTIKTIQEC